MTNPYNTGVFCGISWGVVAAPRMRAAKFTETLNAEDDTMPKKMPGLQG